MTAEELRQWLLNNRVSDSSTSKCPRDNVCSEIPFRVSSYHMKFSQLITIWDKLAGFSIVRFLLRCTYDCGVCSGMLFGRDLCNAESGNLIYNANELTGSYIVPAFIERYFRKDIVVCSWMPFSKNGSYRKKTSQSICNTNCVGFWWKTLLHRLCLTLPSHMDFFSVTMYYTVTR